MGMSIYDEYRPSEGMTFEEYHAAWAASVVRAIAEDLRAGQHAMNLLWYTRPDLYNWVHSWYPVDPYYRNAFLPRFWAEVAAKW